MNALELHGLEKHYPDFTLGPIDLELPGGTVCGLIGENGAGKSTTIKLILDMIDRDAGTVKLFGQEGITPLAKADIGVVLGGLLGAVCGYVGGRFDAIMMRVLDSIMCIPSMMMALAIVAALGSSLVNVLLAMTISNVPWYCRIIRSSVLGVTGQTYIEAARSCGTSDFQIIMTHVLPNAMGPIIVQATMGIGGAIISAAGISFVGMGIQPPAPEWGAMLNEAKTFMTMYPYMVVFPGLAIGLTALSMNLMGDGLRDALDPKLKD